jgi:hypothetical protein
MKDEEDAETVSTYDDYEHFNGRKKRKESPEESVRRLRAEIAAGGLHLRPELADSLMRSAQHLAEKQSFPGAITLVDEAIGIAKQLIRDGQVEFQEALGRCMLFRAIIIRISQGPKPGLLAFNNVIHYLSENRSIGTDLQNELAVALMNRAEVLIEPFGALSAAIAAQEQAVRIWTRMAKNGEPEFRHQLVAALLSCAEAKEQSGDTESAAGDYKKAIEQIQGCLENDESEFVPVLLQALMRLAHLLEHRDALAESLEVSAQTLELIEKLQANGHLIPAMLLPALHLHRGLIYERVGEPETALEELELCIGRYRYITEREPLNYFARVGIANAIMCRGNVFSELKRFKEADDSFKESAALYKHSEDLRLPDADDSTFIPYSIGVVQLNHANMLAAQEKLDEAVKMKMQALAKLHRRYDSGHTEILPNIITAYRKMVGIERLRNNKEQTLFWLNKLIAVLEPVVDDGRLEYIGDLAAIKQLRSICFEEQGDWAAAEKDVLHSLRLHRTVADDEPEDRPPAAKLQWSELLEHAALFYVHQGSIEKSFQLFHRAIDDVRRRFADGHPQLMFDILLAYSKFLEFAESQLQPEDLYPDKIRQGLLRAALNAADSAVETAQQQRPEANGDSAMFFGMKAASFLQQRGALSMLDKKFKRAGSDFAAAAKIWEQLEAGTDKLRSKAEYYRREANVRSAPLVKFTATDPFRDRQLYYIGEQRQSLHYQALCALELKQTEKAEQLFERSVGVIRALQNNEIQEANRLLLLSLMTYAKAVEEVFPFEKTDKVYKEAKRLMKKVLKSNGTDFPDEVYLTYRHLYTSYTFFLLKHNEDVKALKLLHQYMKELVNCENYPSPEVWVELCRALEILTLWKNGSEPVDGSVRDLQRKLLISHPLPGEEPIRRFLENLGEDKE